MNVNHVKKLYLYEFLRTMVNLKHNNMKLKIKIIVDCLQNCLLFLFLKIQMQAPWS